MNKNNTIQPANYSSLNMHIGFEEVDCQELHKTIASNSAYTNESKSFSFLQHHIDSVRFASNDNNPFHDSIKSNSYRIRLFKNDSQTATLSNFSESKTPLYLANPLTNEVLYGVQEKYCFYHKKIRLNIGLLRGFVLGSLDNLAFHYSQ